MEPVKQPRSKFRRKREGGFVIVLIAVFLLFVVGAMAALSIDIVTFYTGRSEAQLSADAAALAGARVLANSGATSSADASVASAATAWCQNVGTQVAQSNLVGGQPPPTVSVTCSMTPSQNNPTVSAQVQATLPTFFARIWGTSQITVAASATAEAYNPSGVATGSSSSVISPVAPLCVKPWLLPNLNPNPNGPIAIFNRLTGQIEDSSLLGWSQAAGFTAACGSGNGDCTQGFSQTQQAWQGYPGDPSPQGSFPAPSSSSVACSPVVSGFTPTAYQLSVAGCVQIPIACNAIVDIDFSAYGNGRNADTAAAVNCLAHSVSSEGDSMSSQLNQATAPFQFLAGGDNPMVQAGVLGATSNIMVSDSLVTVPVFDCGPGSPPLPCQAPNPSSVQLTGFVQFFLDPNGMAASTNGQINSTVINLVGCGSSANGTPVIGNGASAVPVRLIAPSAAQ